MFKDAIDKASTQSPMFMGRQAIIPGRQLLIDGDALCYACAGRDDTEASQARVNLMNTLRRKQVACGAEHVRVLVTARGSHKGHRYAIARVKPYQGQRTNSRRPKNWEYLRGLVEGGVPGYPTEVTAIAEADDLFSKHSFTEGPENIVIATEDKDMRMVPGWHQEWDNLALHFLPVGTWELFTGDKLYGRKWFWMQMLHGDGADNIPGLPKMTKPDGKLALCGPATAEKLLASTTCEAEGRAVVLNQYRNYYGEEWAVNLLEQAILLWMRQRPGDVFDVCAEGNPMYGLDAARSTILQRIAEVQACQPG